MLLSPIISLDLKIREIEIKVCLWINKEACESQGGNKSAPVDVLSKIEFKIIFRTIVVTYCEVKNASQLSTRDINTNGNLLFLTFTKNNKHLLHIQLRYKLFKTFLWPVLQPILTTTKR